MVSTVRIHQLNVSYQRGNKTVEALHNFSLYTASGTIDALVGPSGCGKSTLLHVLAGVIREYRGEVQIDGQPPTPRRQSIGLVPQHYGLLPWKRVQENIFLPARLHKQQADHVLADEILRTLELDTLLHRYPHELSGGQQQRVALARAFIQRPGLLLMDEPFSALDALTAERGRHLFMKLWQEHRVTTLFVTHNIEEAACIGQRVILLSRAPGTVTHILEKPTAGEIRQIIQEQWS
ncbi:MAG: ABC transporter ATP-binding protein [Bacteroides sp.]|nr:ABC transporter ATP-binding protein [Bacteroides sp.]